MLNDIQSTVFSRLKNKYPSSLKTKYPDTTFTTSDRVPQDPKFPTVYVHERGAVEMGSDLDGVHLSAVQTTFQIDVTDNSSMENTSEVMNYVLEQMKALRFKVVTMPEFQNSQSVYRKVGVFRRVIADGDTL